MNSAMRLWMWCGLPLLLLPAGCLGGKAQSARPEVQLRSETALIRGIRAEQKGDVSEAEKLLTQSLDLSTSVEDNPARVTALINLARIYRLQHDQKNAETCIDRALSIPGIDPRLGGEAVYEKALVELAGGRPESALEWSRKAIAGVHGNALGSRLNLAGRIQLLRGNLDDAQSLASQALGESRASGQTEEEANSLRIMGKVARSRKEHARGIQFFQEALQIDKRVGRSVKIADDLQELGETARNAGDLNGAVEYLQRAYEVNLAGGRLRQAAENQAAISRIYSAAGQEGPADRAAETARKLFSQAASQEKVGPSETIKPSNKP